MILHYLRTAFAKFRKAPFAAGANVLTLALGLACFIAAYGVATYWRSGDSHHPAADRLYYVCMTCENGEPGEMQSALVLADALRADIPELEAVGRFSFPDEFAVSTGDVKAFLNALPVDPELFTMLAFDFVEGSPDSALRRPGEVVLTQAAARRLFGDAPALGRTVLLDGMRDMTVAGVIAPLRAPSILTDAVPEDFDMFLDVQNEVEQMAIANGAPPAFINSWSAGAVTTIVRVPPAMSQEALEARVDALTERVMDRRPDGQLLFTHTTHPIGALTASMVDSRMAMGADLGVSAGAVLMGLGALILVVAWMNYANLAAAQTSQRTKEIGMRRVLGAGRAQLLAQHVLEAGLLTLAALALALLVVALAAPVFETLLGVQVTYFLTAGPEGIVLLGLVSAAVAIAAALWPALTMARVQASDAIGAGKRRGGAGGVVSRVLVAVQFFSASFLLIVVAVTQIQHAHVRGMAFHPADDPVVILDGAPRGGVDPATLDAQLRALPQIRSVTSLQFLPWGGSSTALMLGRSGEPGASGARYSIKPTGPDYFETFNAALLAGRLFDPAQDRSGAGMIDGLMSGEPQPLAGFVVDERMAQGMGFATPQQAVGQTVYATPQGPEGGTGPALGTIIGVVETDQSRIATGFSGVAFTFDPDHAQARIPALRIARDDIPAAMEAIQRVWDSLAPDIPMRAQFSDALFEEAYAPFHIMAGVFIALSGAALLISTTGILAIAVHVAARRRREIGVRKTLGASTGRVLRMLIVDFSKPVVIGNLVAWPFAWAAAQTYLQPFAERAPLTLAPFAISLAVTLLLAWFAVGGQAWRAASVKPALVLRTE